jgi:cyanophycin synthetase
MKIVEVNSLNGPNYWSGYRQQLIVMKIHIGELEERPTDKIEGFYERIAAILPSLYTHRCSEDYEGGFFMRVKKGTWMGHVIEHIALEIQTLAGMECGFGRTRSTGQYAEYNVIFSYLLERAGRFAARAAVQIAEAVVNNTPVDVQAIIDELVKIKKEDDFGPSTQAIVSEARKRKIPFSRLDDSSLVIFGHGNNQRKIRATMTSLTSSMGVDMACDKEETKRILSGAYIPVPDGRLIYEEGELEEVIDAVGFPIVIKPINGNHGRGITANIQSVEAAHEGFQLAKTVSNGVIVEKFVEGFDFRFLVINYKLVAVAKRTPAMIIGDGFSTVQQLIDEVNSDPRRGEGHEKVLTTIKMDAISLGLLSKCNLELSSVLPIGKMLVLKDTANISTGGTAEDVTDRVHPANVQMAERIARIMNLDICGIDVICWDVATPVRANHGGVLEVNACPGFRMHTHPAIGLGRNVGEAVMSMLFPEGKKSRIPTIAITGTNGKTTTTRLIAHLARSAGHSVGFTTTDGIYINGTCIHEGDCTGPVSAQTVLHDPTVDFAVLECARGGILRSGLGFDQCDISIITNISEDHLGLKGIETLSQMTRVKAVVANSTKPNGYCILNADDDLVYGIREELDCNIGLFSVRSNNARIRRHCEKGGWAAIIDKGYLVICKGLWRIRIEKLADIPLSMEGKATAMVKNLLPATLAAMMSNLSLEMIRQGLRNFVPSPQFTPGRMNIFKFADFEFMIDYAHNIGGFEELKHYLANKKASRKVGIIAAVGDRREEDIRNIGVYAAQIFDEIIIRHDNDLRGRTKEALNELLIEGIRKVDENKIPLIISDEMDAIRYAIDNAVKNSFITLCTDKVQNSIEFVSKAVEQEFNFKKKYVLSKAS